MEIRNWRTLERHPLSAEYEDIKGRAWERFKERLREKGIVGGRKIIVYEKQVLDGWQLYRACVELDIKPEFAGLPDGVTLEEFVEIVNDNRRHETQERATERADARRERVVAARVNGQSIRQIAEEEGVSVSTVHSDLDVSTVRGRTVEPESGKVTGKDGREQPATRAAKTPEMLCDRCQRTAPGVGIKGCAVCADLRRTKPAQKRPAPTSKSQAVSDPAGVEVPGKLRDAYGDQWLLTIQDTLALAAEKIRTERMATGAKKRAKHFPFFNSPRFVDLLTDVDNALDQLIDIVKDGRPLYVCPSCGGSKCTDCLQSGLLPKWKFDEMGAKK